MYIYCIQIDINVCVRENFFSVHILYKVCCGIFDPSPKEHYIQALFDDMMYLYTLVQSFVKALNNYYRSIFITVLSLPIVFAAHPRASHVLGIDAVELISCCCCCRRRLSHTHGSSHPDRCRGVLYPSETVSASRLCSSGKSLNCLFVP